MEGRRRDLRRRAAVAVAAAVVVAAVVAVVVAAAAAAAAAVAAAAAGVAAAAAAAARTTSARRAASSPAAATRVSGKICAQDSYCCSTAWDAACVSEVSTICGSNKCSGGDDPCPPPGLQNRQEARSHARAIPARPDLPARQLLLQHKWDGSASSRSSRCAARRVTDHHPSPSSGRLPRPSQASASIDHNFIHRSSLAVLSPSILREPDGRRPSRSRVSARDTRRSSRHAACTSSTAMRPFAVSALVLAGCTVDVGKGTIDPIVVDQPLDLDGATPPLSVDLEFAFLTAEQSAAFADQYGSKLDAVDAIDVEVQTLEIDDETGTAVTGCTFTVTFEGVTLDEAGDRVRLPKAMTQKVLAAVSHRTELMIPTEVTLSWPQPAKPNMSAFVVLQPIVVVNALKGL